MKETLHDGRPAHSGTWSLDLRRGVPLEWEMLLFALVSAMDFAMTWRLLNYDGGTGRVWFVESNPIARYFLYSWGFDGLVFFKASLVVVVIVICQIIARQKLSVARRLLIFATLAVLGVVGYSAALMVQHV